MNSKKELVSNLFYILFIVIIVSDIFLVDTRFLEGTSNHSHRVKNNQLNAQQNSIKLFPLRPNRIAYDLPKSLVPKLSKNNGKGRVKQPEIVNVDDVQGCSSSSLLTPNNLPVPRKLYCTLSPPTRPPQDVRTNDVVDVDGSKMLNRVFSRCLKRSKLVTCIDIDTDRTNEEPRSPKAPKRMKEISNKRDFAKDVCAGLNSTNPNVSSQEACDVICDLMNIDKESRY